MKIRLVAICVAVAVMVFGVAAPVNAQFASSIFDGFENDWTDDYAPNWENITYRHGEPSDAQMLQMLQVAAAEANGQTITPKTGNSFLALTVTEAGVPESSTNWWGGVRRMDFLDGSREKESTPSVSVSFYDMGADWPAPMLCLVPYVDSDPDAWTDVQFGQRRGYVDNYWHAEAMAGYPYWSDSELERSVGWRDLKIALSSDGQLSYYIDDVRVGDSGDRRYDSLGTVWLSTHFVADDFENSTVYFDDFQFHSTPEPAGMAALIGMAMVGFVALWRRRK